MVQTGHDLGLKVGWYDNNCICGERLSPSSEQVKRDVEGDVKYIAEVGFDGLKADGCGPVRHTPTRMSDMLLQSSR
eukprot:SAG31_NODE_5726_length_2358_cov_1.433820_2_plen_76_part_00